MRTTTPATATDLYELTMAAGYWAEGRSERAVFELFVRHLPGDRAFLLAAGLEDVVGFLENFRFTAEEIDGLRVLPIFRSPAPTPRVPFGQRPLGEQPMGTRHPPPAFFDFLAGVRFTGDLWAMPEGTPFFASEPILTVAAPILEAQIVETALLALVCYPTSVATKAARVVAAAAGRDVVEFGGRRAPGTDAALIAARAAVIGGCAGTSNVEAGLRFGIPVSGTIAHSWVMSFDDEQEAFRAYQRVFPRNAILLLDTYDTLRAARGITERFRPGEVAGVRLDSGDLAALSKEVRAILDAAGFTTTKILASGDLDEERVADLIAQGAPIDAFGVGTELTTVRDAPALGAVYKLVEIEEGGRRAYRMKLSAEKATYPGQKQVWRRTGRDGRNTGDTVTLVDEPSPTPGAQPLLTPILQGGRRLSALPALPDIQRHAREALARLPAPLLLPGPPPEPYPVTFSERLLALQAELRAKHEAKVGSG